MKAKDIPCRDCGGKPNLFGADTLNEEGPWGVSCLGCGRETLVWAYPREAWANWRGINNPAAPTKEDEK